MSVNLEWNLESVSGQFSRYVSFYYWQSKCGNYRVYRIEIEEGKNSVVKIQYGACIKYPDNTWQSIANDKKMGPGYPRYEKTIQEALDTVEQYVGASYKTEVISNAKEVIRTASEHGLLSLPILKKKKKVHSILGTSSDNRINGGKDLLISGVVIDSGKDGQKMHIRQNDAKRMLVAAGLKSAADCNATRLQIKLNHLKEIERELHEIPDPDDKMLLSECLQTLNSGQSIIVDKDPEIYVETTIPSGEILDSDAGPEQENSDDSFSNISNNEEREEEEVTIGTTTKNENGVATTTSAGVMTSTKKRGRPARTHTNSSTEQKPKVQNKDRFGCMLGREPALINSKLTDEPQTAEKIAKKTGLTPERVNFQLRYYAKKLGYVKETEEGWVLIQ